MFRSIKDVFYARQFIKQVDLGELACKGPDC
jgi:hypothetical protein